ncbi:MFS transporter [Streptosporangium canum]|uniref:MFS transporter n=1 Tax=Streptosporangium canum TaxID=324952 RepID=UPI0037944FC9
MKTATTPWGAVSIVLVGAFLAVLDSFIVIVAGPSIQADLGASDGQLQWILAGYQLTYAVVLITGGRLGDLYGRRRIFVIGIGLFTVASAVCAVAQSAGTLIGARFVQGLGAALILPQVYAFLTVLVAERDRPRAFGALGMVIGLATTAGQLVGGVLIGADLLGSGWRPVFWINVPIGLVVGLLACRRLPDSGTAQARRLDRPGVAILSAALFLITFPLIQGHQAGWSWWTWACLAASIPCLVAFVLVERRIGARGGDPLVRIPLFRIRSFSAGILLVFVIYTALTSYYLVLSISLQDGLGLSAIQAGLVYTPAAVTFFLFSLLAGKLVPSHGRRVLEAGAVVLALGYAATAVILISGHAFTPGAVIPTLMLQSAGGGLLITPSLNAALSRVDPEDAGAASGVLSTAQQIGGAVGVAVIGVVFFGVFDATAGDRTASAAHGLAMASLVTLAAAMLATALVFLLPKSRPGGEPVRESPRDTEPAEAVPLRPTGSCGRR